MGEVLRRSVALESFDAIAEVASGWDIDFKLLGSGHGSGELEVVATAGVVIQRNRLGWDLHQRGEAPRKILTFGVGADSRQSLPWGGQEISGNWLALFPVQGEFDAVTDGNFHTYTLSFEEGLLNDTAHALGLPSPVDVVPDSGIMDARADVITRLREMLHRLVRAARQTSSPAERSALARAIERDLPERILRTMSGGTPAKRPPSRVRDRALKRSLDFIRQADRWPVTVRELCEASGASWRTLDYAFKERFGVTPKAYLRARRLNGVRRDLRVATPGRGSIGRVAGEWGFWHMGASARDYRKLFGELPSETLGRAPLRLDEPPL